MSNRRPTGSFKRFKFFTEKSDFEAPLQFMCDLPPVPIEPKLVNFSIPLEKAIKYAPTCLEMNQEQTLFAEVAGGINVDLINSKIYQQTLDHVKLNQLAEEDLELSRLVLSADSSKTVKANPNLNLARSNSTKDIMAKLNLKKDKEKSRYSNLNKDEVSMYLRHTTIMTSGSSKVYGQKFDDPIRTVEDYQGDEFFESGEALNTDQFNRLLKLIDKSFDKIKEVKVGMQKPGRTDVVTAKSVKAIYPCYELLNKHAYLCQYYDNPLKGVIKDDKPLVNLNNESILLKDAKDSSYKLYQVQNESRGLLGKRKREETDDGIVIRRTISKYEKKGVYRYTQTDEDIQQSAFMFYDIGNEQLSYLPINKRLILVRKKEAEKKKKMFIPTLDNMREEEEEDDVDREYRTRYYRLAEREYTEQELSRKKNNLLKTDFPIEIHPSLIPLERLQAKGIDAVYDEPPMDEEEVPLQEDEQYDQPEELEGSENVDDLFGENDDEDQHDNVSIQLS